MRIRTKPFDPQSRNTNDMMKKKKKREKINK